MRISLTALVPMICLFGAPAAAEDFYANKTIRIVVGGTAGGEYDSHARMLAAIPQVWRFTVEMTNADEVEQRLFAEGVAPNPEELAAAWRAKVADIFASATLPLPEPAVNFYLSGRRGLHTEHLGILLAEMQFLQRAYPDATW